MKQSDYPRLKNELTSILPIYQTDAWKLMQISHQDMSDIVKLMLSENLIKRMPAKTKGRYTYLLEPNHQKKKKDYSSMIAGQIFAPCTGCSIDCSPVHCVKLTQWILA